MHAHHPLAPDFVSHEILFGYNKKKKKILQKQFGLVITDYEIISL